jgi:KipI family sensor histidine kinase inhibitor
VIRPFGESAYLVEVDGPDEARAVAAALQDASIPGVVELVPALRSVLVELDPASVAADLSDRLETVLAAAPPPVRRTGRHRTIPVVYGGEHGPDLDDVASACGLEPGEVIRRHAAADLRVLFLGFAPGFAYIGDLPPELRVPRRASPRARVPKGSVAVAGAMTAIYPADLPAGWRIIGRTPVDLFDPRRDPPAYLVAGDTVRCEPIDVAAWDEHAGVPEDWA